VAKRRTRAKAAFPKITVEDAHAALRWLHALGRVTAKDISNALSKRQELVSEIREKLEALGGQGLRFLTSVEALKKRAPVKRRRKASAAAKKMWALQGAYMGSVRMLSAANRAKMKRIRETKGVEAAIAAAKKLGKG
jgi:hypothetical protein